MLNCGKQWEKGQMLTVKVNTVKSSKRKGNNFLGV